MSIEIVELGEAHLPAAAALFVACLQRQRRLTPALPALLEDVDAVVAKLAWLAEVGPGFAALEGGRLVGYLGSIPVARFRNTARKGAYVPEWGHGVVGGHAPAVYRALYRAAAAAWTAAGSQVHAISLLACDSEAVDTWFWNGFGLTVIDAVRPVQPLAGTPVDSPLAVRRATAADAEALARLDVEHCRHYTAAPVFMAPPHVDSAAEFVEFLARPRNRVWLALDGETPAGFLRCAGYEIDGVGILETVDPFFINGAYVQPAWRGRRAMPALLDAALREAVGRPTQCCSVNFESFNPEAAAFWPRHFDPVCFSLTRIPEMV